MHKLPDLTVKLCWYYDLTELNLKLMMLLNR